jgi:hypothetical protein
MCGSVAALAVASIFYVWKCYFLVVRGQERLLRERVAYMLWMAANQTG